MLSIIYALHKLEIQIQKCHSQYAKCKTISNYPHPKVLVILACNQSARAYFKDYANKGLCGGRALYYDCDLNRFKARHKSFYMKFSVHQASFIGNRKYNQDRVAYAYRKDALLLVLADGMGGHLHGELAATIAIETFVEQFSKHANSFDEPQQFLTETMREAHKRIMTLPHDNEVGFPGTTCVVALLQHGKMYAAHAGDSRLYVMRDKAVLSRTRDHSMVQQWLDWGILTEEEARVHPRRNQITNCLGGIEDLFYAESAPVLELQPGDVLLLSSDGLWGPFSDEELAETFATLTLSKSLDNLMVRALERESGHSDNITGVAVLWGEGDQDHGSEETVTHELEID